uniref:Uncharacterized protein n=1 Tax=Arundo donax TaxID=35708 RepID=A0A0A9HR52_ARUDO
MHPKNNSDQTGLEIPQITRQV